jgi:hypothetical protein
VLLIGVVRFLTAEPAEAAEFFSIFEILCALCVLGGKIGPTAVKRGTIE